MYSVWIFLGCWGFEKCLRDFFSPEKINFDFTSPAKFLPDFKISQILVVFQNPVFDLVMNEICRTCGLI